MNRPRGGPHRQADLRRAISTAYYAVFHTVLTAMADRVVGRGRRATPHYALAYRGLDHRTLSGFCTLAARASLPSKYSGLSPDGGFNNDVRRFARSVFELQQERHRADYDPAWRIKPSEATALIRLARDSIGLWTGAPGDQREAFLMLLLFPPR
ncbi:MAG: hypothetical protein EXR07_03475 [Acetobacteraceae bacterium]|nr:hypothetical protein [Acetobacteraceae bacterium]